MSNSPFYQPGNYVGEVTAQALSKASTGNKQFVLRCKILGTPMEDSYTPAAQQYERTIYMTITDKTIDYVISNLQRLGYTGNSFGPLDPQSPQHVSFVGNQVDLYCKHELDQQGGWREKWQISNGGSALKVDPLDQRDVRELDALFGKALKSATKDAVKRSPAQAPVAATDRTEITDDDIPF